MKPGIWALVGLLVGAIAFSAFQAWKIREADAAIAGLEATRDSALHSAIEADAQSAVYRTTLAALRDSVTEADSLSRERVRAAQGRAQAAEDSIRALLRGQPEAQRQLDELLEAHRQEVAALVAQIDSKLAIIERQDSLIASQSISIASWRAAYEAESAISREWRAKYRATQTLWHTPAFRWLERTALLGFGIFAGTKL